MFSHIPAIVKTFALLLIAILTVSFNDDPSINLTIDRSLQPMAPPTFSKVFTPSTIGPGSVSTITFTITNGDVSPVTGLAFTDVLPGAITIADPANASTSCDRGSSGSLSAPDGGSTITLSDAQIGGLQSCTVTVDVTASTPGAHTNPAITLSSSAGSAMSLPVDLTVATDRPGFSKSFAPSSIPFGGRSTLTFTIDNNANSSNVLLLAFTDNLPTGLVVADPADVSNTCNASSTGVVAAVPGSSLISYSNGSVGVGLVCTVTVDVVATGAGMLDNVTGELTSVFGSTTLSSGKASATLESTVTPLALEKSFIDDPAPPNNTVTLEFKITNFDRNFSATGVAFTDDLTTLVPPLAGLTFSSLLSNDCGGSVSGIGGTMLGFSGGTLTQEGSCTIRVSLSVPVSATTGSYTNITSTVTGTVGGSPVVGNMASDKLFVEPAPLFTKEFIDDPATGGGTVTLRFTITNTDPTSALTSIAFTDDIGGSPPPDDRVGALPGLAANSLVAASGLEPEPLLDPCGAGSVLTIPDPNDTLPSPPFPNLPPDPTLLNFTGGGLAVAGMPGDSCSFDVVLDIPTGTPAGGYVNTTSDLTAMPTGTSAATDTLIIIAAPRLTKEFTDDPVAPGGTVTLEFTLAYPSEATGGATGISFTDDLNAMGVAGLTVNLPPIPDPPCGAGSSLAAPGNVLTLQDGNLMPGQSCTFSVTLNVPLLAAPGNFTNSTSQVSATVAGLMVTSAEASDVLKVVGLVFTKEFLDDPTIAGDTTTLRFTIENIHPTDDATGIGFSDDLAAVLPGTPDLVATLPPSVNTCGGTMSGPTSLSYSGGSVTSGSTCTIELTVLVPAGTADDTYGNITSNLTATQGGAVVIDPATDFLVVDSTRLQLTKSYTDDPIAPGDPVTLEFTLTNLDALQAASGVGFTDDLGAALAGLTFDNVLLNTCGDTVGGTGTTMVTVSGVSLAAAGSCTLRVSLTVPVAAAPDIYTNTTSDVIGTMGGFPVTGAAASDDLEVIQLLFFSKSFDGPTTATGQAILTFTLTNPGTDAATGISFLDDLDAVIPGLIATSLPELPCGTESSLTGISVLTFTGGELPPMGGMCSFDVDVLVPVSASAGTFPNVTSDLRRNGLKAADPATADLVIEPPPTFGNVFTPDTILAGGISTLTFTIDNSASALAASALAFTDNLPAGVVIATPSITSNTCGGSLTATAGASTISLIGGSVGAGANCTIDVNLTSGTAGVYVNVTGDLTSSSGNSGSAADTLTVSPAGDISVTKSDGVTSAIPGGSVTYTIVVANAGPSPDPSVSLADTFPSPPLTCAYTSMAAGGASGNTVAGAGDLAESLSLPAGSLVTYTVTCDIDADATGTLANTASITASITDLVPSNNSAIDDDTVLVPSADLAITKSDGVMSAVPGEDTLTYTIIASNSGLSDDPSVSVTDTLPTTLSCTYTSVAAGGASGNTAAGSGDLNEVLSMPVGSSVTYTVICTIDADATGTVSNTVTISGSVNDPDTGNNSATDSDTTLLVDYLIYLPLINKDFVTAPDLIVQQIRFTDSTVQVVIQNQGNAAVPAHSDYEFWVDLYVNPTPPPTGVNQICPNTITCDDFAAWGVTVPLLTQLTPGGVITLTVGGPNQLYGSASMDLAVGSVVYAQVDSYNQTTAYGVVQERDESNNINSTVVVATVAYRDSGEAN